MPGLALPSVTWSFLSIVGRWLLDKWSCIFSVSDRTAFCLGLPERPPAPPVGVNSTFLVQMVLQSLPFSRELTGLGAEPFFRAATSSSLEFSDEKFGVRFAMFDP